jgi:hypothetical protein
MRLLSNRPLKVVRINKPIRGLGRSDPHNPRNPALHDPALHDPALHDPALHDPAPHSPHNPVLRNPDPQIHLRLMLRGMPLERRH